MKLLADLIGESPGITAVRAQIGRLLQRQTDARRLPPILIEGETGTGKGILARAIHRASARAAGPFVDVNCAAIPETLLEAELFGFERGAFTDAKHAKAGLFQAAHHGTLFLDEVGLLPGALQAKLLTVLEERAVRRLGSTRSELVDVWIVAATNEDLAGVTRQRRFREDLYHRLAVLSLRIPPLRERGKDILLLAEHFLARACSDYGLPQKTFTADAQGALLAYPWPGNVRELANVIERVALLSEASQVTAEVLALPKTPPAESRDVRREVSGTRLRGAAGSIEVDRLLEVLRETNWSLSRAAARLGIPRNTLRYRIEKLGLRPEESSPSPRREPAEPVAPAPRIPAAGPTPGPASGRWEPRRLTLLNAILVTPPGPDIPAEASRALQVLAEKVQSFGGRVEEASPNGIVAAFGVEPVENATVHAALAATAILKARERARAEGEPLPLRIGIHTGRFMVGHVGGMAVIDSEEKRQARAVLDALLAHAEPNTTWVSEAAARFLERRFELVSSAPHPGRGQVARLAGREGPGLGPRGHLARFVGREGELELLQHRLASAVRGHGQVVGIGGEAGIGKSRLLYEFRQRLDGAEVTYLEAGCVSYGATVPYFPVLDLLRQQCGITEAENAEGIADKVDEALRGAGINDVAAPILLHLLGVTAGTEELARLSPEVLKVRTFETLRQLTITSSRQRPLIIAVEDLHWIDTISEGYFVSLTESVAACPILLLLTYRSGYRPQWIDKSYATQIALQPLSPSESLALVRSIAEPLPEPLTQIIVEKTEGNPFFLEELTRAAGERDDLGVPDTIQEVLLARIDRLSPEERDLLQSAAAIGKDVPFALLQMIADRSEESLGSSLRELQVREFLYEARPAPDLAYTFKHALTQEVAYGSLPQERRRTLHVRIMGTIERLYPDRLGEHVERLALHALRGEMWEKGLAYFRQAGAKATARSAHREAVACFEQALVALDHLPESRERLEQGIDLRFDLRSVLFPLGDFSRVLECLREAETLAEALGDQDRRGRLSALMSINLWMTGDPDQGIKHAQRALAIATALKNFPLRVLTNFFLGQLYYAVGDYSRAIGVLTEITESLRGDLFTEHFGLAGPVASLSGHWLALCLAEVGQFAKGIARGKEARRIAEADDNPMALTFASCGISIVSLGKGDLQEAIPVLERDFGLSPVWMPIWLPHIGSRLGYAYALSGRVAEALPLLEQAVEQASSMRLAADQSLRVAWLSEGYLLAGRIQEAATAAGRALDLSREHRQRGCEAWALRLLGEIASHREPLEVEKADEYYRQALALARELGMRPLKAHCHFGLGTLYRRIGKLEQARSELSLATELYRSMEMTFWLDRAEAERD